jgi:hypothetical protein
MTPKEKAQELINKFKRIELYHSMEPTDFDCEIQHISSATYTAKQCALITVEEIILSAPFEPVDTDWDEAGSSAQYWYPQKLEDSAKWWATVKEEINKL